MVKVALSCVHYKPESRPEMSVVLKMLEGSVEIPKPLNHFQHLMHGTFAALPFQPSQINTDATTGSGSNLEGATLIMRNYEIELATA
ncbi:rust resistance kinase Lr10-like [Sesbania bispinosa]|nr:rust resistance kinase Lr10-like [Sesbania bispinosa]